MKIRKAVFPLLAAGALLTGMFLSPAIHADEHGGREGHEFGREEGHEGGEGRESRARYSVPRNQAYKQECSSCHVLYAPGLLPERSWREIMKTSDKHFGENLALEQAASDEILAFLTANSAERTSAEYGRKILRGLGNATPTRITETPYMTREHRKVKKDVYGRPSIGSPSNCAACHPKAAEGDFEEDAVSIPKQ